MNHLDVLVHLQLLIEHDPELSTQVVSQVDESGLSLISLATLQGQSPHRRAIEKEIKSEREEIERRERRGRKEKEKREGRRTKRPSQLSKADVYFCSLLLQVMRK